MELRIALQPKQQTFEKLIDEKPIAFYGGARGGGKSVGIRKIFLHRRFKYPGSNGVIFRKTYPELEANHIRPLFEEYPQLREYWHESKKLLTLPNGSTLQFCHCNNEKDVDLYQGREFHDLGIDEVGQWTETMFRKLHSSNRSSKPGIKARAALTGNPGGVGHGWLKRIFIEKRFNERENPEDYAFIQALVDDNRALIVNDPEYLKRLESEPNEALRRAWRWGDWDIFAGQFFQEIHRDVHLIEPFSIPPHWNRFGAYDYGFNHPAAFGWFANDEDGNTYLYREHIAPGKRIDEFCQHLNSFPDTSLLTQVFAGHDCWAVKPPKINKQEINPPTIAEEFLANNIILRKAVIDRVAGAAQVRKYLAWRNLSDGRTKPRLMVFKTCPVTFDCLTRMIHNPDKPEDVLKVDAEEGNIMTGDDAYDMLRYGLMSRPIISDRLPEDHKWGTPEWAKNEAIRMEEEAEDHFKKIHENTKIDVDDWV